MTTTPRMRWMDILRGGAVVLVVIFHVGNTSAAPQPVQMFNDGLGSYRLAALFFASGLLLERSLAKGTARFLSGKLRHLVWPYLVWTALIMLPLIGLSRGLDAAWWVYPRGSHTWFLIVLATVYVVGLLTRWVPPGWIALGFLVTSQLIDRNGFALGVFVHEVSWWGFFFFVGVVLVRHLDVVLSAPVWLFLAGAGVTTTWAVLNALPDACTKDPARGDDDGDRGVDGGLGAGATAQDVAADFPRVARAVLHRHLPGARSGAEGPGELPGVAARYLGRLPVSGHGGSLRLHRGDQVLPPDPVALRATWGARREFQTNSNPSPNRPTPPICTSRLTRAGPNASQCRYPPSLGR